MTRFAMPARAVRTFLLLGLAGCTSISAEPPISRGSYPLAEHQAATLSGAVSVRYTRFEDSRCPKDAMCIWAGKVSYHFTLTSKAGSERFALDVEGEQFASTLLPGVRFEMSFAGVRGRPAVEHAVVLEVGVDTALRAH